MPLVARLLPGWNTLRHTLLAPRGVVVVEGVTGVVGVDGIDCNKTHLEQQVWLLLFPNDVDNERSIH